jgi:hypothetical protein
VRSAEFLASEYRALDRTPIEDRDVPLDDERQAGL